jgi:hypothetical protein
MNHPTDTPLSICTHAFEYNRIQTRALSSPQTFGRWPFRKSFGDPWDGSLDQLNAFLRGT